MEISHFQSMRVVAQDFPSRALHPVDHTASRFSTVE